MDLDLYRDAGETCLGGGMHCHSVTLHLHCVPKNVHLFIFQITCQKLTDFNDFWCVKSWKKFDIDIACIFAHIYVYCSQFTLGNPRKSFFNSIIHTYFRLFTLSQKKHCNCCAAPYLFTYCYLLLLIICVALCRVPMVRESQGILRSQGKQRGSGKSRNFKIPFTRPIIYAYFHNFCRLLGASPPDLHQGGALPL